MGWPNICAAASKLSITERKINHPVVAETHALRAPSGS
jgi:hypothetical protein